MQIIRTILLVAALSGFALPAVSSGQDVVIIMDQSASMKDYGPYLNSKRWILSIAESLELPSTVFLVGFDDRIYEHGRLKITDETSLADLRLRVENIRVSGLVTDLEVPFQYLADYRGDIAMAVVITDGEPEIWDEKWLYLSDHVHDDERYRDLNAQFDDLLDQGVDDQEIFGRLSELYFARNRELIVKRLAGLEHLGTRLIFMDISGRYQYLEQWAALTGAQYVAVFAAGARGVASALDKVAGAASRAGGPAEPVSSVKTASAPEPAEEPASVVEAAAPAPGPIPDPIADRIGKIETERPEIVTVGAGEEPEPSPDRIADMIGSFEGDKPEAAAGSEGDTGAGETGAGTAAVEKPAAVPAAGPVSKPAAGEEKEMPPGIILVLLLAGVGMIYLFVRFQKKTEQVEQPAIPAEAQPAAAVAEEVAAGVEESAAPAEAAAEDQFAPAQEIPAAEAGVTGLAKAAVFENAVELPQIPGKLFIPGKKTYEVDSGVPRPEAERTLSEAYRRSMTAAVAEEPFVPPQGPEEDKKLQSYGLYHWKSFIE